MFIFLLFFQFNFITFFQACLIAFTSEFIPKLVYKYEHSWEMKGYVNFTLATSPHQGWGEVGKTECRYRAFRDHEGSFTPSHYKILGLKLAFVIIFEVSTNVFLRQMYAKHVRCCMQFQEYLKLFLFTPPRTPRISRLKSQILKPTFLS